MPQAHTKRIHWRIFAYTEKCASTSCAHILSRYHGCRLPHIHPALPAVILSRRRDSTNWRWRNAVMVWLGGKTKDANFGEASAAEVCQLISFFHVVESALAWWKLRFRSVSLDFIRASPGVKQARYDCCGYQNVDAKRRRFLSAYYCYCSCYYCWCYGGCRLQRFGILCIVKAVAHWQEARSCLLLGRTSSS